MLLNYKSYYYENFNKRGKVFFYMRPFVVFGIMFLIVMIILLIVANFVSKVSEDVVGVFMLVFIICALIIGVPLMISDVKESISISRSPHKGLSRLGGVLITSKDISLCHNKKPIKTFYWSDVVLIEKFREKDVNYLMIMTLNYLGKPIRDSRNVNYIEIPARLSIENAVKHYSGKEITLRPLEY